MSELRISSACFHLPLRLPRNFASTRRHHGHLLGFEFSGRVSETKRRAPYGSAMASVKEKCMANAHKAAFHKARCVVSGGERHGDAARAMRASLATPRVLAQSVALGARLWRTAGRRHTLTRSAAVICTVCRTWHRLLSNDVHLQKRQVHGIQLRPVSYFQGQTRQNTPIGTDSVRELLTESFRLTRNRPALHGGGRPGRLLNLYERVASWAVSYEKRSNDPRVKGCVEALLRWITAAQGPQPEARIRRATDGTRTRIMIREPALAHDRNGGSTCKDAVTAPTITALVTVCRRGQASRAAYPDPKAFARRWHPGVGVGAGGPARTAGQEAMAGTGGRTAAREAEYRSTPRLSQSNRLSIAARAGARLSRPRELLPQALLLK
jgi:hypothetical protein